MNRKLYEIDDAIEALLAREVDPETGEITPDTEKALDELGMEREAKVLAIARYLKGERLEADAIEAEAKVFDAEAERVRKRARSHRNRAASLERYLGQYISEGEEIKDATARVWWKQSPGKAVLTTEAEQSPKEYVDPRFLEPVPATVKVLKNEALKALRAGEEVRGFVFLKPPQMKVD